MNTTRQNTPDLPDLSDDLHAADGTLIRSVWALGSHHRLAVLHMGRIGDISAFHHKGLVAAGIAVEYTPDRLALTAAGAELAYHAADDERGLVEPFHPGWLTNAEARRRGLPVVARPVLWWDGQRISEWIHP